MESIISERAGKYIKVLNGEMAYQSFQPAALPPQPPISIDEETYLLLGKTHQMLGRLDGISEQIPDIDLFVAMFVRKEVISSSQIEGTLATLDDILNPDIDMNVNLDVAEVINYIKATQFALNRINELPICNRLLKETHQVLLEGIRGQERNPGEFRRTQNWIGPQGGSLKNAAYVPPAPEEMQKSISEWEKFINAEDEIDPLIKIGLIHYQFESIHPFLDGNGRIGRLLITLWLIDQKILKYPVLYISYYLKRNRTEYYDRLMDVRFKGHFEEWLHFFLKGLIASAEDASETIRVLTKLHEVNLNKLMALPGRKESLLKLLNYIERNPIIEITKTAQALELQYNTVAKAVDRLAGLEILCPVNDNKRNRRFVYTEYMNCLKKDT